MNNKIILLLLTFIFAGSAFCNTDAAKAQSEEFFPELLPSSEVLKKQSPKTEFKAARPADIKTNNKSDVKTIMNITPVSNTVKASEKDLNEVTNKNLDKKALEKKLKAEKKQTKKDCLAISVIQKTLVL